MRVVTPKGGKAAVYHVGKLPDWLGGIQRSQAFVDRTSDTLAAAQIEPAEFAAVYYPGGHGQYWDVLHDERIARTTAFIHERGGIVGSAGHGTVSLLNVRSPDGEYFVKNKRMTCFPSWAEKEWMDISEYGKLLPFDMQEVLQQRKAQLVICTKESYKDKSLTVIPDDANRLVTGSFAFNAKAVAQEMCRLLECVSAACKVPT